MDVYQETFEFIEAKINKEESKNKKSVQEPELDMYADDFDTKEKEKLKGFFIMYCFISFYKNIVLDEPSTSSKENKPESQNTERSELKWEFKWAAEDEKIEGPYNTSQMIKWQKEKYFKPGVMVRKCGDGSNFYSLGRMDFELYE